MINMRSHGSLEDQVGISSFSSEEEPARSKNLFKKATILLLASALVLCVVVAGRSEKKIDFLSGNPQKAHLAVSEKVVSIGEDAGSRVQCGDTISGTVATSRSKVYYELMVPDAVGGVVTLDTCGSPLDTWLYVYRGDQTTTAYWNCDDCGTCGWQTVQSFVIDDNGQGGNTLAKNSLYTIGVGAWSTRTGSFTLKIICDVACGHTVVGYVASEQKVGYQFVVPAQVGGSVTLSTCGSSFDTWLYTYTLDGSGNEVEKYSCDDCGHRSCSTGLLYRTHQTFAINSDGSGTNTMQAGQVMSVRVGGWRTSRGTSNLAITCAAPPTPTTTQQPVGCGTTIRRDWNDLSQAERDLFVNGYKALRDNGKLGSMTAEHLEAFRMGMDNALFHGNDAFLPWHRLFLVEMELALRALGGAYACISIPYWDWSRTAGQMVANNPMWNQNLGGNGGGSMGCVQTGLLRQGQYETSSGGCLTRSFRTSGPNNYPTVQQVLMNVESTQSYTNFRSWLEGQHDNAHVSIGGTLVGVSSATDDVLFWMLHNYVDMVWALRSDCHNLGTGQSSQNYPNTGLPLTYPLLAQQDWSMFSGASYTVADALTTTRWGYTFDASNMVSRSGMTMGTCTWTNIGHGAVKDWNVADNGDGKLAWSLNAQMRAKPNSVLTDAERAHQSCMAEQQRQVAAGIRSSICTYGAGVTLETCGNPSGPELMISLDDLLKKRGVKGNPCVEQVRRDLYDFAKETGNLRGLCNGESDPVC